MYIHGWEIENILRSHNCIRKHRPKTIGGTVCELTRSAHVISSIQTSKACDEHKLYKWWVGRYKLHLWPRQCKWTCYFSVVWWKTSKQGGNWIIKRLLGCIRTWWNIDPAEPWLKVLSSCKQHEYPYSKRVCCMLWTKIIVPVYRCLPLQPEDPKQLSIVYCKMELCIGFMYRECSYCSQIIFMICCFCIVVCLPKCDRHALYQYSVVLWWNNLFTWRGV